MDGESFAWQRGFAAFSVSASSKDAVIRYIRTQDAHHKKMDYKSELIALLKKYGRAIRSEICFRLGSVPRLRRSRSYAHLTHGVAVG